ncbi:MAG: PPC domain-containing protein [Chloroflexi bacterium]|nr:PPC domain-containing protein [Chloroflexota bacterium]
MKKLLAHGPLSALLVVSTLLSLGFPVRATPALAQADPCPEPNNGFNNACFIGPAAPIVQGFISDAGDVDAYKFEVAVPLAQVEILLTNLPEDYDLHMFTGNAAYMGESVKQGNQPDAINLSLFRGTYFVFVNSSHGGFSPNRAYALSIAAQPTNDRPGLAGDPCPDPNDGFERACPVTPGTLAFANLASADDVDAYRFDVPEGDSRVTVALGDVPGDFVFGMYKADGTEMSHSDSTSTLIGRVDPGTYFVKVGRQGGEPNPAPYELLVTVTPPAFAPAARSSDPCPEPNDENEAACSLGTGAPAIGFISNPFDIDRYKFEVTGARTWVHLDLTELPADYELEVQAAPDGTSLATSHNSGTFPEAIDVDLDPGTYIVVVYSLQGGASDEKPYKLTLGMSDPSGGPAANANVYFADNFNSVNAHFTSESRNLEAYEVGYYDGEYVVRLHHDATNDQTYEGDEPAGADLLDFQLDLDARVTRLPAQHGGFTVLFRYADDSNTYELYVDTVNEGGAGAVSLSKFVEGKLTNLSKWADSPAIKTGSQPNHVTIRAVGDQLTVAINGQQLISARDGTYKRGDIALGVVSWDQPSEVRFDNVLVTPAK